jgi:hypothetical protein
MDLDITLMLGRPELIVGESTAISIGFTNASSRRLSLPDPAFHGEIPKIRVRNVAAGKDILALGEHERERQAAHEFVLPEPLRLIAMAPKQQAHRTADLLQWIGPLPPGRYELTVQYDYQTIHGVSAPVPLTVEPLDLAGAATVGSHSGDSPYPFCFWDARTGRGSALILSYFVFEDSGQYQVVQSVRLADLTSAVTPAASVTQNQFSYTAQWVAWLSGEGLTALYVDQGTVESPLRTHPLPGAAGARLVTPLLLDLTGSDGSRPGRGIVPVWLPGPSGSRLEFHVLEPDGSMSAGSSVTLAAGELQWGRSIALSNGERRFYLAIERNGETDLEFVKWGDKSASRVDHFPGAVIGGGLTVDAQDVVSGAVAVRSGTMVSVHNWRSEGSGNPRGGTPTELVIPGNSSWEYAVIAPNPAGKPTVLIGSADRRWFWVNPAGSANPMQQTAQFGSPIDAFWLNGALPQALMAGAQTGLTYQPVR